MSVTDTIKLSRAQLLLSGAITRLCHREIAETGIRWRAVADAPNTWEALQAWDLNTGYLPVWNGGSEHSIYGSAIANYQFRYWHDMGHLFYRLGFTPDEERELQQSYHLPEVAAIVGEGTLPYQLYYADTVGQIDYIVRHGVFPDDQRSFVRDYVTDKARALDTSYAMGVVAA